jgi:hypothetical protein
MEGSPLSCMYGPKSMTACVAAAGRVHELPAAVSLGSGVRELGERQALADISAYILRYRPKCNGGAAPKRFVTIR